MESTITSEIEQQTGSSVIMRFTNPSQQQESEEKLRQLQAKLNEKEQQRQAVRKEKDQTYDKDRDPEEDFKLIDQKFGKTAAKISLALPEWRQFEGDKGRVEKHFDEVFAQWKELRDYVATYAYTLPSYQL